MTTRNLFNSPYNIGDDMDIVNNCEFKWPHHRRAASCEYNVCVTHDLLIHKDEYQVCPMRGFLHTSLIELMKRDGQVEFEGGFVKHVIFAEPVRSETWHGYREYTTTDVYYKYTPVGDLPISDINEVIFWHCEEVKKTDRGYC